MVTGRPVDPKGGEHGVVWNDERTQQATVHRATGAEVDSIFRVVHDAAWPPGCSRRSSVELGADGGLTTSTCRCRPTGTTVYVARGPED